MDGTVVSHLDVISLSLFSLDHKCTSHLTFPLPLFLSYLHPSRVGTVVFSALVCAGQVVYAMGAQFNQFYVMLAGRFIFGLASTHTRTHTYAP